MIFKIGNFQRLNNTLNVGDKGIFQQHNEYKGLKLNHKEVPFLLTLSLNCLDYNLLTTTPPWGQEIHMFNHFGIVMDTLNVSDKHMH